MLEKYSVLYIESPALIELFAPAFNILHPHKSSKILAPFEESLSVKLDTKRSKRTPLRLQDRKPMAVTTYLPRFDTNFSLDRKSNDPNRERANKHKLDRQYTKEYRGAVRELRKDSDFVARAKLDEVKRKDGEYKKKIDGIMGGLANQEGAMRGYEKEKDKMKKR
jgi:nucleolar protein 14